jgi:hypothetical protein
LRFFVLANRTALSKLIDAAIQLRITERQSSMTLTELCLVLAALFTFATLILKVVETARRK